jgi:tryptophan synthase alpha chain
MAIFSMHLLMKGRHTLPQINTSSKLSIITKTGLSIKTSPVRPSAHRSATKISAMAAAVGAKSVSGHLADVKAQGKIAFIPFIVACDPDAGTTVKALKELDAAGADVVELGVPYSDPLADGPIIQAAATRALANKTTLDDVLRVVAEASPHMTAPIVLFTYFNPIMSRGLDKFCSQVKAAGAAGLLVPDIPMEETEEIRKVAITHGLELVLLTTPTTPKDRMKLIAQTSQGFVYLVSVTGVTGVRVNVEARVEGLIADLKTMSGNKSVAVGFGVSKPEHALQLKNWGADGVIVGSALVKALGESGGSEQGLKAMKELAMSIRNSI